MSHCLVLLPHRRIILGILRILGMISPDAPGIFLHLLFVIIGVNAAHIDKMHRKLLVPLLFGASVQPHQGKLNLGMPRISFRALLNKMTVNMVCHITHNFQKLRLSRALRIGHRRLDHMSRAV